MYMDSRLDKPFFSTWRCSGNKTPSFISHVPVNLSTESESLLVGEGRLGPVVNINKKPELFSFLFDDIEFLTRCEI